MEVVLLNGCKIKRILQKSLDMLRWSFLLYKWMQKDKDKTKKSLQACRQMNL